MDQNYFWNIVFLLAIGTISIRFSIIAISKRLIISEQAKEIFSFIPAAILPALVTPMVFFHKGAVDWVFGKERLFILILATAISYFSRSTLATIAFGLVALYLIHL